MNFSLPNLSIPNLPLPTNLSFPTLPSSVPQAVASFLPSGGENPIKKAVDQEFTNKVNEASQTFNADLQQTVNTAVATAKSSLLAVVDEVSKNLYTKAFSLVVIFVGCLAGLILLAFVTKLIRDWLQKRRESRGNPPKIV